MSVPILVVLQRSASIGRLDFPEPRCRATNGHLPCRSQKWSRVLYYKDALATYQTADPNSGRSVAMRIRSDILYMARSDRWPNVIERELDCIEFSKNNQALADEMIRNSKPKKFKAITLLR